MKRKLFFLAVLVALLFAQPVKAQGEEPPIPNRPPYKSYVLDTLNWLSEAQEQEINAIARQLDSEGKAQIYVATLDDCGSDKAEYRRDIFNSWEIGTQKTDGGLLILVCWYGGDTLRRSVEVKTDEKMQGIIPDAATAATAEDNFVPAFKENEPGAGLVKMAKAFNDMIRGERSVTTRPSFISQLENSPILYILLAIILLPTILLRKNKSGRDRSWDSDDSGGVGDSGSGGGDGGGSSTGF